jgi:hypothetical protein
MSNDKLKDEVSYTEKDVKGNISLVLYMALLFKLHIKVQFLPQSIYTLSPLQRSTGLLILVKWPLFFLDSTHK